MDNGKTLVIDEYDVREIREISVHKLNVCKMDF